MIKCPDDAFDDIIDIGEVAFHLALIEDIDRFALQNGLGKDEEGHVRPPPWTIHGKKAQAGARQPIQMGIAMSHELISLLAGGIERDGMIHIVMD